MTIYRTAIETKYEIIAYAATKAESIRLAKAKFRERFNQGRVIETPDYYGISTEAITIPSVFER